MSLDIAVETILQNLGYDIQVPLEKIRQLTIKGDGELTLVNGEDFTVSVGEATIRLGTEVSARITQDGILDITGVEVDIRGPFDPNIENIKIEQGRLIVETTVGSRTIDLPRRD